MEIQVLQDIILEVAQSISERSGIFFYLKILTLKDKFCQKKNILFRNKGCHKGCPQAPWIWKYIPGLESLPKLSHSVDCFPHGIV